MLPTLDPAHQLAYYEAALRGLRFIEQRSPVARRFGPDADARWAALRGHLATADRLDILLRDADAQWPAAFGARTVFTLRAVAEDDPFGSTWPPLDPNTAEELWRRVLDEAPPSTLHDALAACALAWGISLTPFDPGPFAPTEKILLAGPSAIAATALAFAKGNDLDWSEQVTLLATPPSHRQLAALVSALLNTTRPPRLLEPQSEPEASRVILSDDADPTDRNRSHTHQGKTSAPC